MLAGADRRLLVLAGAAISLLVPATLAELVNKATDKEAGLSFWQSIRPSAIAEYLTAGPEGALEQLRLLLIALAALVVVPAAAGALRRGRLHRPRLVGRVMVAGLVLASAELIVRAIPAEAPALGWPREIFTRVLDWGHVYASSIWVGGLVGLAVLGASMRTPAVRRGRFWALALRRFSVIPGARPEPATAASVVVPAGRREIASRRPVRTVAPFGGGERSRRCLYT